MTKFFLLFLNVLSLLTLWLACLICFISPASFWYFSFLGLGFPFLVLINSFFLILWLIKRHKMFWICLAGLALSSTFIRSSFGFNFFEKQTESGIKIMSYNVRNFDLYNWTGNKQTRTKIMELIKTEKPDIICFQEFYSDYSDFNNERFIADSLGYSNYFFHRTYDRKIPNSTLKNGQRIQFGLAIFSKYEIKDTGDLHFENSQNNDCIYADLEIHNKTVRVYNLHLQSVHLDYDDYDTMAEIEETQNAQWYRIKNILRKLKKGYIKRGQQTDKVAKSLENYKDTKIVCGDFNDVPVSYSQYTISKNLKDAFSTKGVGFGKTLVTDLGFFKIDNILFDKAIKINSYKTIPKKLSDHFPVIVTFNL